MGLDRRIIGVDSGSVTVSMVVINLAGAVLDKKYVRHHGRPAEVLRGILRSLDYTDVAGLARTSGSPDVFEGAACYDTNISLIKGVKSRYKDFKTILNVGGEKFSLIEFDSAGNFTGMKSNTSCAAGTGGFLDQQAKRLKLAGSAELSERAAANRGEIPKIASRCSVFAKTDIIHSQQEGYSLDEICDGLALGLARNIADTFFDSLDHSPMVFTGGVAKNSAVVRHMAKITGFRIESDEDSHLFGAIGAALLMAEEGCPDGTGISIDCIKEPEVEQKEFFYEPLRLELSDYPDFDGLRHYNFSPSDKSDVEVDIYREFAPGESLDVCMGVDVGSTSTKAIIIDDESRPVAGFYTRTAGRPVPAVQAIFEACSSFLDEGDNSFIFKAVGTTGSGRKFSGKLIGADTILDEISAHARAASFIDPDVDTIIEIGGQDAKFTALRKGVVTFSQMNTVCAAGTGSFIEEQAMKLGVPLAEYSSRAEGARAPLSSDRCTVFMERDINHYLNRNYRIEEILAAVLYSVRENYLQKVASEGHIGDKIFFQGATAKNRALVAAFEQKLKKPVLVSKYCHLTGALGAAITAAEESEGDSAFRGLDIFNESIPVRSELCGLCLNHCRIRIARVKDEEVAYGFLCGRDYQTKSYVEKERVPSLLRSRKKAISSLRLEEPSAAGLPVIGLPAGLRIFDELPLWRKFFNMLGIRTVSSEDMPDVITIGKKIAGAEFCSPMSAFHGHAAGLAGQSDILFLPIHVEDQRDARNNSRLRKFCYYTQFSSTLVSGLKFQGITPRRMMPLINHRTNPLKTKYELHKAVNQHFPDKYSFLQISSAYDGALDYYRAVKSRLKDVYKSPLPGEIKVVLIGRPYTVLLPSMNKGIPDFFAALGIDTYFTDSLPQAEPDSVVAGLLDQFHWAYPSESLSAADFCTREEGLYPVFITSFKCSPDSFTLEYFKRIMDQHEKPYLILQLDEHDSNVGYETRIEAGVRAFRNHLESAGHETERKRGLSIRPVFEKSLKGKTLLLPAWDSYTIPLVAANLRHAGIDARVLEESPSAVSESMRMNTGQCIPVNAITHEYAEYIRKYNLKPRDTVLWMINSEWACNIPMYPSFMKSLLEKEGGDVADAGVYIGNLTMVEISPIVSIKAYFAYMFGGNLKKIGCMIRPYELVKGETDKNIGRAMSILISAFGGELSFIDAVKQIIEGFDRIEYEKTDRPKVAVFGDLYVRDNDVMNQNLIRYIEDSGGEVIVTPYNEYAKIISGAVFKRWLRDLKVPDVVLYKSLLAAMELLEGRYYRFLEKYIGKPLKSANPEAELELSSFNIRIEQEGESYENILKIFRIMKEHPDVALFVQTNPAFCCPSLVTEAMGRDIEKLTGVPVLSITYDGTETPKNKIIVPYLKFFRG